MISDVHLARERSRARTPRRALMLALALLLLALPMAPPAAAAPCLVTTNADGPDPGPAGSLRAALNDAGCDAITFQAGLPSPITLASPLPVVVRPLTISGPGIDILTIQGNNTFPLLHIDARGGTGQGPVGMAVAISGLTLTKGHARTYNGGNLLSLRATLTLTDVALTGGTADPGFGGAGAAIAGGVATLTRVLISGNTAPGHNLYRTGAGLAVDENFGPADVTIADSAIVGNIATGNSGGGLAVVRRSGVAGRTLRVALTNTVVGTVASPNRADGERGGGIFAFGATLTLTNSIVSGNSAQYGGGLFADRGTTTLTNSTVSGNTATAHGGGLHVDRGTATLANSTVSGNTSGVDGGGLLNNEGTATLTGSTFSGNEAGRWGGGLHNFRGTATLTAVTLVANRAGDVGGGLFAFGSSNVPANTRLGKSIVAGNLGGSASQDCTTYDATYGPLTSDGDNLVGSGPGCPATGTGDITLTGALSSVLDPALADNGGPTRTHNLVPGSPAADRIPLDRCTITSDQRGVTRPQNGLCDIGAVEYTATPPSPSPNPSPSPDPSSSPGPSPSPTSCGQRFGDVPAADPACVAIEALASRAIINGCDSTAVPPLFCPQDTTLRHQMAALIVRAMPGWAGETYTNTFTDPTEDAELWSRVATLQHHGVVGGYTAESCVAQGKAPPCYGPLDPVLKAQAISFVTRAMVAKGYWANQPIDPALYGGALDGTGHEQDAATYWYYTRAKGGVPDLPEAGGFPLDQAAPRAWFARLLWTAIKGTPAAP